MNIITIATQRSLKETRKEWRYKKYYSSKAYKPGSIIEVIDGNKKAYGLILKCEDAQVYKQAIRDGAIDINKLKLSKTGANAHGIVIAEYPMEQIKEFLREPTKAQKSDDALLKQLFPKKKKRKVTKTQPKATTNGNLGSLSIDRYLNNNSPTHHSQLQLFVDEVRTYFNEDARHGQGSFSYYLGFCKRIPMSELWQIFGEVKQTNKSRHDKKKLFWWKIGQRVRNDNTN